MRTYVAGIYLVVVEGPSMGTRVALDRDVVLGRDEGAGLRIDDRRCSRRHARVIAAGAELRVEDLGSTNGTYLNGARLRAGSPIVPGDRIRIGTAVMEVRTDAAVGPSPPPAPAPPALRAGQRDPAAAASAPPPPGTGRPVRGQRSPESAIHALAGAAADRRTAYVVTVAIIVAVAVAVAVYLLTR